MTTFKELLCYVAQGDPLHDRETRVIVIAVVKAYRALAARRGVVAAEDKRTGNRTFYDSETRRRESETNKLLDRLSEITP
jgi:hypothetical protein